jgi:Protein of unknown function (DUF2764).
MKLMKRNYYYLISSLPDWKLDDRKPALNSLTFREMLGQELHVNDFKLVEWLYLPFDHTNILNKLYKKDVAFDTRGGYPVEVVEKIVGFVDSDSELDCVVERYIEEFCWHISIQTTNLHAMRQKKYWSTGGSVYFKPQKNKLSGSLC